MARYPFVCVRHRRFSGKTEEAFHGTCELSLDPSGGYVMTDFRHEDGSPAALPGHHSFVVQVPLPERS